MEPLTDRQWAELLGGCQRSAWHLELRGWYGVDDEKQRLARFLATGHPDHAAEAPERQPWLDLIRAITGNGVQVRRVRVVCEPLNDYMRFSYADTQPNIDAGEQVRWLPRRQASRIPLPGNDFWLLDGDRVLFNYFTDDRRARPAKAQRGHLGRRIVRSEGRKLAGAGQNVQHRRVCRGEWGQSRHCRPGSAPDPWVDSPTAVTEAPGPFLVRE